MLPRNSAVAFSEEEPGQRFVVDVDARPFVGACCGCLACEPAVSMMLSKRHTVVTGRGHSACHLHGETMNPTANLTAIFIDNALPVRHPRFCRDDSDRFDPSHTGWTEASALTQVPAPQPLLAFLKAASSRRRQRAASALAACVPDPHITRFHHGPAEEQSHKGRCLTFPWKVPPGQRLRLASSYRHVDPDGTPAVA